MSSGCPGCRQREVSRVPRRAGGQRRGVVCLRLGGARRWLRRGTPATGHPLPIAMAGHGATQKHKAEATTRQRPSESQWEVLERTSNTSLEAAARSSRLVRSLGCVPQWGDRSSLPPPDWRDGGERRPESSAGWPERIKSRSALSSPRASIAAHPPMRWQHSSRDTRTGPGTAPADPL